MLKWPLQSTEIGRKYVKRVMIKGETRIRTRARSRSGGVASGGPPSPWGAVWIGSGGSPPGNLGRIWPNLVVARSCQLSRPNPRRQIEPTCRESQSRRYTGPRGVPTAFHRVPPVRERPGRERGHSALFPTEGGRSPFWRGAELS